MRPWEFRPGRGPRRIEAALRTALLAPAVSAGVARLTRQPVAFRVDRLRHRR